MIEIDDITKMEISPSFNFHGNNFLKTFVIDMENRKAYWEDKAYRPLSKTIEDARESNDVIYSDLVKSLTLTENYFNDEQIRNFKQELIKCDFINELI